MSYELHAFHHLIILMSNYTQVTSLCMFYRFKYLDFTVLQNKMAVETAHLIQTTTVHSSILVSQFHRGEEKVVFQVINVVNKQNITDRLLFVECLKNNKQHYSHMSFLCLSFYTGDSHLLLADFVFWFFMPFSTSFQLYHGNSSLIHET